MSFSSRRRNYLLTPHRRDGLIEWMKSMLQHSFVLDALETTGADTFSHFEVLIEEHRAMVDSPQPSKLQQLVPTIGTFHTGLPLRKAFLVYNDKHRLTKRKHITISFNEIRHILNLAQIMAFRTHVVPDADDEHSKSEEQKMTQVMQQSTFNLPVGCSDVGKDSTIELAVPLNDTKAAQADLTAHQLNGPRLMTFDGDQTLYSDGANFEENPKLAHYLTLLLQHGVHVAIVTAAGYEYMVDKYQYRLSGLLMFFAARRLTTAQCERFYLFGGECNYLLRLGADYQLHPVREHGPGGWMAATSFLPEAPGNWQQSKIDAVLDVAEQHAKAAIADLNMRGRVIRKKRSIGLVPTLQASANSDGQALTRESLDEVVLRVHEKLHQMHNGCGPGLPYCAFNGGTDCWVDVGNKRVGVQILQSYLGIAPAATLHIGDQFLNTGNDYAARAVSPCIWIINPTETTYILKSILRLAGIDYALPHDRISDADSVLDMNDGPADDADPAMGTSNSMVDFGEMERRTQAVKQMDVYTGEMIENAAAK